MKRHCTLFTFIVILSILNGQTTIPEGNVYGTWNTSGSPYQVTGNIQIPGDSTLFVMPGVTVEFQGHFELKVMGNLLAVGTETDSIFFTVSDTTGFADPDTTLGGWYGIRIYDIDAESDSTKLDYCRFEYGKAVGPGWFLNAGGALCVIEFNKVSVSNCFFVNNSAGGPDEEFPAGGAIHLAWSDVLLKNNTLTNNYAHAGGAIQFHDSNPVFENNTIIHNQCVWDGGGISSGGVSNPSFSGDIIINNHSDEIGGGIAIWEAPEVQFENVTVAGNTANWGGGIGFLGTVAEINNSTISENYSSGLGGGIGADESVLTIKNSTFVRDTAILHGGAIHKWIGSLILSNCTFNENAGEWGGAINIEFSTLEVDSSSFMKNSAWYGGALRAYNCNFKVDSCLFEENDASSDGGAIDYSADCSIFDSNYSVNINNSRLLSNTANGAGGFSIQQSHTDEELIDVIVDNCEIAENAAHHVGGFRITRCISGFSFTNSIVSGNTVEAWTGGGTIALNSVGEVNNCLFYGNQSATVNTGASTGGLGISNNAQVNVINCTFTNNMAGVGGGMQLWRGGDAIVTNNIIWGNSPDQMAVNAVFDSLQSILTLNYNDIQYGYDSIKLNDTVSIINWGTGNLDIDPLFVDQENEDFHLPDWSPVIGTAIDSIELDGKWYYAPDIDLEGNSRPDPSGSLPDMGAYENPNGVPTGLEGQYFSEQDRLSSRNFPNPFNSQTTIEFNLPKRSKVTVKVYNMLGVEQTTLFSSDMQNGIHRVIWNPGRDKGGFFFYKIIAETTEGLVLNETKRMLLLK